ncbi:type II toxin-antitoxin system HipA family toxin [Svornostia abyssi]|uniref:Type II toxin-antitoxin system HipA family toxin n=1 Tax=Svornostia abyssi TaxID=2898438 RepID=A0ABY5PEP5_9ACTN|nr:type II toxin-antitoxin system HipA family toxin [Parviterribacteraceae bacterium J379]
MSLAVVWDGKTVGTLERVAERSREYAFSYSDASRALSLSLPNSQTSFTPAESRPFFEALLPEGVVREQIAAQLKLATSDSYGLLAALGRDCAGAIQILEQRRMSDPWSVNWLDDADLDDLVRDLPHRPLGVRAADERLRLSLAGVQRKAVLVRDRDGRFGQPRDGMPSTHILKPQATEPEYPDIAVNEYFCMRLATACGLPAADVDLLTVAERPCLLVTRFDRDLGAVPVRRLHQEDLCQALGLTPDFKYQQEDWRVPSFAAFAKLLDDHSVQPGADRLRLAGAAVFNYVIGNADAHAKNFSVLHEPGGVRLSPLYDLVSTAVYPELNRRLALSIGDAFAPEEIGPTEWTDFAVDMGFRERFFAQWRNRLAAQVAETAHALRDQAHDEGWHTPLLDDVVSVVDTRAGLIAGA